MATKQTRRSISVRGETYESLRRYCDAGGRSMSDVVEEQLAHLFSRKLQAPHMVRVPSSKGRPAPTPASQVIQARVGNRKNDYRSIKF